MSKRVAAMLRGHARLLGDVRDSIERGWKDNALVVLDGVIVNLLRDADKEEQRGKDWDEQRKAELAKLGIPEGERLAAPPQQEPWL